MLNRKTGIKRKRASEKPNEITIPAPLLTPWFLCTPGGGQLKCQAAPDLWSLRYILALPPGFLMLILVQYMYRIPLTTADRGNQDLYAILLLVTDTAAAFLFATHP